MYVSQVYISAFTLSVSYSPVIPSTFISVSYHCEGCIMAPSLLTKLSARRALAILFALQSFTYSAYAEEAIATPVAAALNTTLLTSTTPSSIPGADPTAPTTVGNGTATPEITKSVDCFVNSYGKDFDGNDAGSPASWCVCAPPATAVIPTKVLYPTLSGQVSDKACAYTELPASTITVELLKMKSSASTTDSTRTELNDAVVTSCRLVEPS
jgi:hypothetical protein